MVTPDDDDDVENHAERVKNEKLSLSLSLIGSDRIGSDPRSAVSAVFLSLASLSSDAVFERSSCSFSLLLSSSRLVSLYL